MEGRLCRAEVFSGGQPHTAMCVGDGVNVCAYEPGACCKVARRDLHVMLIGSMKLMLR